MNLSLFKQNRMKILNRKWDWQIIKKFIDLNNVTRINFKKM